MRARDMMTNPALTVTPETPVKTAENLLARHGFSALPVLDEQERLVGIVTEADFVADRFPTQPRPAGRRIRDIMTKDVCSVDLNTDAAQVARLMLSRRIRSVPVTEGGQVVGVVTRQDFLRVLARPDTQLEHEIQRRLAFFGGSDRWVVQVCDGEAVILDRFDREGDRRVAIVLAEGVPGVVRARCYQSDQK